MGSSSPLSQLAPAALSFGIGRSKVVVYILQILLSRPDDHRGEGWLIHCIRKTLQLQKTYLKVCKSWLGAHHCAGCKTALPYRYCTSRGGDTSRHIAERAQVIQRLTAQVTNSGAVNCGPIPETSHQAAALQHADNETQATLRYSAGEHQGLSAMQLAWVSRAKPPCSR